MAPRCRRISIHIDINPDVFNANFPAKVAIAGDAGAVLRQLLKELEAKGPRRTSQGGLREQIRSDKAAYRESWYRHDAAGIVNPARFFDELRRQMPDNGIISIDDGNHTFLTAELMPIHAPKSVILPTDFNCMGYAVPAAIGAKLACPDRTVQAIVGDGAFMMTCMEISDGGRATISASSITSSTTASSPRSRRRSRSPMAASPARPSASSTSRASRWPPARPICR